MVEFSRSQPPSSRGPGRGPLKAKTGVRISLGALLDSRNDSGCLYLSDEQAIPDPLG